MKKKKNKVVVIFIILTILVAIYTAVDITKQSQILAQETNNNEMLTHQLADETEENQSLKRNVNNLDNPDVIAEMARENFKLAYPGEIVYEEMP